MNRKTRRALVTGATGGIGTALCHRLIEEGYALDLVGRQSAKLTELERSLKTAKPGAEVRTFVCDFSDEATFANLDSSTPLDAIILMPPQPSAFSAPIPEQTEWAELFNASFIGPLRFLNQLLPCLKKAGNAKVVLISGITSLHVLGTHPTSPAIRGAWRAQAKALSLHWGEFGITVNTLSLGGVLTPTVLARLEKKAELAGISFQDQMKLETHNVPLGRYATPEMVAKAVSGLLSEFSDHITGNNIVCDGGFIRSY